jgi:hypothetical protein
VFQVDAAPSRNGGQPLGVPLPFNSLSLGDGADTVALQHNVTGIDALAYGATWPGGSGVASERLDLFGPHTAANYAAAPNVYGAGDRGSPGRRNDGDATVHGVQIAATVAADRFTLHGTALGFPGYFSVVLLAFADSPATAFGGASIPLAFDAMFQASLAAPGFVAVMPPLGYRSVDVPLPQPNPLTGLTLHTAHVVLDFTLAVPGLSGASSFVLP